MKYTEGFYNLHIESEDKPVLVHLYKCTDMDGALVFGFNTSDGGGILPLSDLAIETRAVRVKVTEV